MEEAPDLSKVFEQLQGMLSENDGENMLQNLISQLTSPENADSSPAPEASDTFSSLLNSAEGFSGADINTVSRIMSIMQAMNSNQNNPRLTFLQALKPFLKESRQQKLDKAAMFVKMASVFKTLKQNDGGGV